MALLQQPSGAALAATQPVAPRTFRRTTPANSAAGVGKTPSPLAGVTGFGLDAIAANAAAQEAIDNARLALIEKAIRHTDEAKVDLLEVQRLAVATHCALSGPPTVPFMPDQELLRRARLANALGSS